MNHRFNLIFPITAFILSVSALPCQATSWQYLNSYNTNGVPNNLIDLRAELPLNLVSDVYKRLPEGKNIFILRGLGQLQYPVFSL
jgi:hypothetical protein